MKLKKYIVYLDDGYDCHKIAVPAQSEEDAKEFVEGNGEVIAVKEITEEFPISLDCVANALAGRGFGRIEIDLILRTLARTSIAE